MANVDRNAAYSAQKWAQHRFAIKFLIDDVTNRSRAGDLEQDGIDPSDVIGQQQKSAGRQIFQADGRNTIKATGY